MVETQNKSQLLLVAYLGIACVGVVAIRDTVACVMFYVCISVVYMVIRDGVSS